MAPYASLFASFPFGVITLALMESVGKPNSSIFKICFGNSPASSIYYLIKP